MQCTWKDCDNEAAHPQRGGDGAEWANLCDGHHHELENAVQSMNGRTLVRAWALAGHAHPTREHAKRGIAKVVNRLLSFLRPLAR